MEPVEKTIIDRCTRLVYRDYLAAPSPEKMPILGDLYALLRKQPEAEAQRIATALEIYVTGSLSVFNHRSTVDIRNRLVCFDIKELGKSLKKIGMLVLQDAVWNRVTVNRAAHKTTWFYVDEFHLLLKEEQTAAYSVEIWKRFRKWGGIPTAITQNIKDLLSSREVENIFENLYCKGWMSNPLLKQQDSQIIRSRMKRFRGKEYRHRTNRQAAGRLSLRKDGTKMNRKILQGLFNGDIIPWERKEPRSEELLETVRKIEEEERYFISKMSLDDCERFQRLSNLYLQLSSAGEESLFSYSFTLGLLLALDISEQAALFLSSKER